MIYKRCSHKDHKGKRSIPADLYYFSSHPYTRDGLQSTCKDCNRRIARMRQRRMRKETIRERKFEPKKDFWPKKKEIDYFEDIDAIDYAEEISPESPIGVIDG